MANILNQLFNFSGRLGRKAYALRFFGGYFALFVSGLVLQEAPTPVQGIFGIGAIAVSLSMLASLTRRVRDIGFSGWMMLLYALAIILLGNSSTQAFASIAVVGAPLLLWAVPSWDHPNGLTHVFALMRRVAMADGQISSQEAQVFANLLDMPLALPEEVKAKAMSDFMHGHQDYDTIAKHTTALNLLFAAEPDAKRDVGMMLLEMAASDSIDVNRKAELATTIATQLHLPQLLPDRIVSVIKLLAKMAKADGVVSKAEVEIVEHFMRVGLGMPAIMRKGAIKAFQAGKNDSESYRTYADEVAEQIDEAGDEALDMKDLVFSLLLDLAGADGSISAQEEEILEYTANAFGASREESHARAANSNRDEPSYYAKVLGVEADASAEQIRKAYREQMQKNHPDKVAHLSEAIRTFAHEESQRIREAFEFFKELGRV